MLKFEFVICSDDKVLWDQPFLDDGDDDDDENALGHEWNGPQAIPVETMNWLVHVHLPTLGTNAMILFNLPFLFLVC
jgi:hypothetical protein